MPYTMRRHRPITTNLVFYIALCIALCALYFMTGCGSGEGPANDPANAVAYSMPPPGAAPDSMHVLDSTYTRIAALFTDNCDVGAGKAVLFTEQEIPYDMLISLAPTGTSAHALHIDYGLSQDSFRLAFCLVQLDTTPDPSVFNYVVGDTVYDWYQGTFTAFARAQWRAKFQYDPSNKEVYFSKVRVRSDPAGPFVPVDSASDPHADVFAWELEVVALRDQNAGHEDSTSYTVFRCIARPDDRDQLRHALCMHMRLRPTGEPKAPGRDLLDNSYDASDLLKMHGADFGSLDPPGYGVYRLPPQ